MAKKQDDKVQELEKAILDFRLIMGTLKNSSDQSTILLNEFQDLELKLLNQLFNLEREEKVNNQSKHLKKETKGTSLL